MGTYPSGYGPGDCMQIRPVDPDTGRALCWVTLEAAMEALEALLRNEHDPRSIRLQDIGSLVRAAAMASLHPRHHSR